MFLSNFDVKNSIKSSEKCRKTQIICFGWFQMFINMKMCQTYDVCFILNLRKKKLGIYHHFSLILCYFWRQNYLKTSILALWATLGNTSWWSYMCVIWPNIFWGLVSIHLKSLSPKYHVKESKAHHEGSKNHFFSSPGRWWNNLLHFAICKILRTKGFLTTYGTTWNVWILCVIWLNEGLFWLRPKDSTMACTSLSVKSQYE